MSQICVYPDREAAAIAVKERLLAIRERIQKKIQSYWSEEVEDVEFEPVDFNADELFHPQKSDDDEAD